MAELPDKRIQKFIAGHHVMTVASCLNGQAWTASCFYVYLPDYLSFIFTTDIDTRHGAEMLLNPRVAANIVLETRVIGKIQGLQISGKVEVIRGDFLKTARGAYLRRFPMALVMDVVLWRLEVERLKFTDNRLGFGRKLYWPEDPNPLVS